MKKVLLFLLIIFNCFSADSFSGNIGLITGVSNSIYTDDSKLFVAPILTLKYNNVFFSGNSIGINLTNKNFKTNFSIEGAYKKTVLEDGDLDGKVNEDRKSPLYLNFSVAKNLKNHFATLSYKRDFTTDGNIVSLDLSHLFIIPEVKQLRIIPKVKYTAYDQNYSNYYFNFTENEYLEMNVPYKENKFISQIDTGILVMYKLNQKVNLNLTYQLSFYEENHLNNTESDSISSVFMTGLTYSF